jgi:hypothetical protein
MNAVIPANYDQWRHCIEVDCGLRLTPEFIAQRLAALDSPKSEEARRFAHLYGQRHLDNVINWFRSARAR